MKTKRTILASVALLALALLLVGPKVTSAQDDGDERHIRHSRVVILGGGGAWLGVHISDVDAEKAGELRLPGQYGAVIEEVDEESPAAEAGLQAKDVIVSFDGERVRSAAHLVRLVRETPAGRTVPLQVSRAGETQNLSVELKQRRARMRMPEIHVGPMPEVRVEVPPMRGLPRVFSIARGPRLGISADEVSGQLAGYFGVTEGVLVREVHSETPAEKAGLQAGDVITQVDEEKVATVRDLRRALRAEREGNQVTLTIVRDKREQTLPVELERPEPRRRSRDRMAGAYVVDDYDWQGYADQWARYGEEWQQRYQGWEKEWQERYSDWEQQLEEQLRDHERSWEKYFESEQHQKRLRELEQRLKEMTEELETVTL
ncbi:MAG: PDZ domain-containing protein [Terriglobia bacterium]